MRLDNLSQASKFIYVGLGQEGTSSKKFLGNIFPKISFEILENIQKPLKTSNSQEIFIVSPGIHRKEWLKNIPTDQQTSNTEIFFNNISEKNRKKIIGISGSKGKSTTTKFTYEALQNTGKKVIMAGNIGVPLLDIFNSLDDIDFSILELSSYQLEYIQKSPGIAIFLNLFPDHLDRHDGYKGYFESKQLLWNGKESPSDHLIFAENIRKDNRIKDFLIKFSPSKETQIHYSQKIPEKLFTKGSVFNADHFLENFGTVQKLFEILKIKNSEEILKKTALNFKGLPHRTEFIAEINGHKLYDDSISTNPDTSIASINFFKESLGAIILGGKTGGQEANNFIEVFRTLLKEAPQAYVWIPECECKEEILESAKIIQFPQEKIKQGASFNDLLENEFQYLSPSSSVTLSPGAKSFDSFKNYTLRGEAWKKVVLDFKKIVNLNL